MFRVVGVGGERFRGQGFRGVGFLVYWLGGLAV